MVGPLSAPCMLTPIFPVLIMMEKQVARMAARDHNIPTNKLPKLQRSSDIEWGMYKIYADELNGRVYNNLRYYFAISITESQTQAVVARALRNANQQLTAWPGYTFNMGDEGTAILGKWPRLCPDWLPSSCLAVCSASRFANKGDRYEDRCCRRLHAHRTQAGDGQYAR